MLTVSIACVIPSTKTVDNVPASAYLKYSDFIQGPSLIVYVPSSTKQTDDPSRPDLVLS